ncbi:MAG: sodium:proton antiporter, partial [Pseudomonadales bacterium]
MDIQDSWLVLLPAIITVCVAVVSRRPIESLLAGTLVGLLMLGPTTALDQFSSTLLEVMMSETIAWVIIVCGLMGSLIMLLLRAGAVDAFSGVLAAKAKSSKSALMYTWLLGIIVFIDDYLNALAVGASMRKVTDQFRVS